MEVKGIKSKDRVRNHGEVFTPDNIVNDMIDLVDANLNKDDIWDYLDKTWLEPACGNGNFLIRILDRKLEVMQRLPRDQWELGLVRSLSTIYGVDIQEDNVEESKERMIELIKNGSVEVLTLPNKEAQSFRFEKMELDDRLEKIVRYILDLNIQQGNALTGKKHADTEFMYIIEYKWNGENVSMQPILFEHLTSGVSDIQNVQPNYIHYTSMVQNNNKPDEEVVADDDDVYDF